MRKIHAGQISTLSVFMAVMLACYSCGSSSPNTNVSTVSSTFARIVACPATTAAAVSITTFPAFAPGSTSIAVNDIVKWTNNDSIVHTVTSGTPGNVDGKFDSGSLAPGATICVQFLSAGMYQYFCHIHTFMMGAVTVQ